MTATLPEDDVAFALTADDGIFEQKSLLLVRSLRDQYPDAPILVFLPDDPDMTDAGRAELEETTTVRTGAFPVNDYPHTAFQRAFELAAEEFDVKYYAALDSDAVVLNPISLPRPDADLYAAPMYMGVWPWQAEGGITADWVTLFNHYDIPLPETHNRGVTDDQPMWPPYYNSGVMITTDPDFPSRFLRVNEELFGGDLTETDPAIETEQVALALFANDPEIDFAELDVGQNWMMGGFRSVPDDVEVLHYQFFDTLATLGNSAHEAQLRDYGATLNPRWSDRVARELSYLVFRGGRVFPRRLQSQLADTAQYFFDWNTPGR